MAFIRCMADEDARTKAIDDRTIPIAGMVTVVVPVYNAAAYLEECLRAVRCQTYALFEVIMVNDGSTDGSGRICASFAAADSRFRLVDTPNRGVSEARNLGIDSARGEYLFFMDADDALHPDTFRRLYAAICSTASDICICGSHYGTKAAAVRSVPSASVLYSSQEILQMGLYQKLYVNAPWGALFRRRIFDDGLRFRPGRRYEDLDLFYKWLLKAEKVAYIPEKLYFYRKHGESFINTFSPARLDVLDVTDEMLEYLTVHCPAVQPAARDRRFSAHFNIWLLLLANGCHMPEVERRCREVIRRERVSELLNPHVRLKNKLGALASYGGRPLMKLMLKFIRDT